MSAAAHTHDDAPTPEKVYFRIGGEAFECKGSVPQWHMMKLAKSYKSQSPVDVMAGMYDFLNTIIAPHERVRFDEFMGELDLELSALDDAVGDVVADLGKRGKGSPSPSSAGATTTKATSQDDSRSPDTVRTVKF